MALGNPGPGERLANAVADSPLQLVGLVLAGAGVAHFLAWAQAPEQTFDTAVATANLGAATPELAAYAQSHPAYLLAVLAGVALFFRPFD